MAREAWRRLVAAGPELLALLTVAGAYILTYATYQAVPGNSARYPLGWWGWFDQGHYYRSLTAFAHADFRATEHLYPPLYALVGAPFYWVTRSHPFVLVDLACLLWFVFVFLQVARRYVPRWIAAALAVLAVVATPIVMLNFVIPWTSTLSAAIVSTLIWMLLRFGDRPVGVPDFPRGALCFGLVGGLLFLTRPLDALATAPLALAVAASSTTIGGSAGVRKFLSTALIVAAGYAVGAAAFVGSNFALFHSALGRYGEAAGSNGYFPDQGLRRAVSLLLDGESVFLEPNGGIIERFPWLLLTVVGVVICIALPRHPLRWIVLAAALQVALYVPYVDLLPNGMWRYYNIHYFKWTFPYLALLAWMSVVWCSRLIRQAGDSGELRRIAAGVVAAMVGLLLLPRIEVFPGPTIRPEVSESSDGTVVTMKFDRQMIDFVDLSCVSAASFQAAYFGDHKLEVDRRELHWPRDFRVIGSDGSVRLLFNRPIRLSRATLRLDPGLSVRPCVKSQPSRYFLVYRFG